MVTIKDIAKACNVSVSTASRALRDEGYVSKEIKEKIHEASRRLGYVANYSAKRLKSNQSKGIGVIISDINNIFYNIYLEKLLFKFRQKGYSVNIMYSFEDSNMERENFLTLLSFRVEAILFIPTTDTNRDLVDLAIKNNILLLQLFRKAYDDIGSITVDDAFGSYLATKYLIGLGCRNISLLSIDIKNTPNRSNGYIQAHQEHKLKFNKDNIYKFHPNENITSEVRKIILNKNPDGIIAGTNTFGMSVISAVKLLPEAYKNIKIVSFDDVNWFELLDITTVVQPIDDIYIESYNYIVSRLNKKTIMPAHLVVTPSLSVRS
ncbi:LacI family DNA-binding transcriptional regulator [Acholeplasma laidlawii]|uniref:LacI family DNA-binding transcriptional regulator n=1 Tax=Acholeplasma laidlawii TaxID=2148 RepID=UPI0021F78A39|nr:LacI family DNA-binding transcriptional regulator [Acholeplasma laidlawii]